MHLVAPISSSAASITGRPIRVMVVDDAVVVRGLVARWVDADDDLALVAAQRRRIGNPDRTHEPGCGGARH